LEQRIVWNLLLVLEKNGFLVSMVDDGDEQTVVNTKKAAMELLFNLDDAYLFVTQGCNRFWIRFVFGNGVDVITDYVDDPIDGFNSVMDKFDAEEYA